MFYSTAVIPFVAAVQLSLIHINEGQDIINVPFNSATLRQAQGGSIKELESLPPADFLQPRLDLRLPTREGISRIEPRPIACQRFEDCSYPVGDVQRVIAALQHEDDLPTTVLLSQFHQSLRNIEETC